MKFSRTLSRIITLGLLAAAATNVCAAAQAYPERPIRYIIPYPPGGSTDPMGRFIAAKLTDGQTPIIASIHSMTPVMKGFARPWQISMCSAADRRLNDPVLAALRRRADIVVGDNEPYTLDSKEDYSVPYHAMRRNLQHLQVEFRQDEIAASDGQRRWADIFGACIEQVICRPT